MGNITTKELSDLLNKDGGLLRGENLLSLTPSEKMSILFQEVARLHKENIEIRNKMIEIVDATQKGFQILNEELTRIAKL